MGRKRSPLIDRIAASEPGTKFLIVQGVDFTGAVETTRTSIIHALRRRGAEARTHVSGLQIHITVTKTAEEQV